MQKDIVVQRATLHRWKNLSSTLPLRFNAVVVDCEEVEVDGKRLETAYLKD